MLRSHSIKPHWMFALDNLVRDAVQAVVTVLSPELGANLAGEDLQKSRLDGNLLFSSTIQFLKNCFPLLPRPLFFSGHSYLGSSTNISTKNSVDSYGEVTPSVKLHLDQISILKSENFKLMNEVIESQKTIHGLLKQVLEENKNQIQFLNNTLEQINSVEMLRHRRDTG